MPISAIVFDEDPNIRKLITSGLEAMGVAIVHSANLTKDSADLVVQLELDLILLDIGVPPDDGCRILEEIIVRVSDPFIVAMSDFETPETKAECRLLGAQDFILKTAPLTEIVARLDRHIRFLKSKPSKFKPGRYRISKLPYLNTE